MDAAVKLALFVSCLVVAVVAGWALGQITAQLVPDLVVPGAESSHVHDVTPSRSDAGGILPEENR